MFAQGTRALFSLKETKSLTPCWKISLSAHTKSSNQKERGRSRSVWLNRPPSFACHSLVLTRPSPPLLLTRSHHSCRPDLTMVIDQTLPLSLTRRFHRCLSNLTTVIDHDQVSTPTTRPINLGKWGSQVGSVGEILFPILLGFYFFLFV